ncbi:MAG: serine/threonine protein kinase [Planctomycetes bacterium]|nr:serine/threonine protein kinase [Planctomycetota bacterium]
MSDAAGSAGREDPYLFAPDTLARELPEFQLVREVGKGSMGIVFEAIRRGDGRRVALKVLPPSLTLTETTLARFRREAELLARIEHPAIVRLLDHGREGRLHWFAMEFVDGITLEERLKVGPLPIRQATEIALQVARALQIAHDHGVVHRDLKPGNLMLREDGRVLITDFGLARESGQGTLTESGAIVGTPMYMPPEQVIGDRAAVGTRSDVYGLGATLYHLLTGAPPFRGPTAQAVLQAVLHEAPRRPRLLRADLPDALDAVLYKAMARAPEERYGSAQELADDLERVLHGVPVLARRPGPWHDAVRFVRRHRVPSGLAATALLLAIGAGLLWREQAREHREGRLAEGELALAQAIALRDAQDRPRTLADQRALLRTAVDTATEVIQSHPGEARAWLLRAKGLRRLQRSQEALRDLDEAERLLGAPTLDILWMRTAILRHHDDPQARVRLQHDLTTLVRTETGAIPRALVAEYLLDLAAAVAESDRGPILASTERALDGIHEPEPRAALARVRLLELRGDLAGAERLLRGVCDEHRGDPLVHRRAAEVFARLGLGEDSRRQAEIARVLDPVASEEAPARAETSTSQPRVDVDAAQNFLQQLDRLFDASSRPNPKSGRGGR